MKGISAFPGAVLLLLFVFFVSHQIVDACCHSCFFNLSFAYSFVVMNKTGSVFSLLYHPNKLL